MPLGTCGDVCPGHIRKNARLWVILKKFAVNVKKVPFYEMASSKAVRSLARDGNMKKPLFPGREKRFPLNVNSDRNKLGSAHVLRTGDEVVLKGAADLHEED